MTKTERGILTAGKSRGLKKADNETTRAQKPGRYSLQEQRILAVAPEVELLYGTTQGTQATTLNLPVAILKRITFCLITAVWEVDTFWMVKANTKLSHPQKFGNSLKSFLKTPFLKQRTCPSAVPLCIAVPVFSNPFTFTYFNSFNAPGREWSGGRA